MYQFAKFCKWAGSVSGNSVATAVKAPLDVREMVMTGVGRPAPLLGPVMVTTLPVAVAVYGEVIFPAMYPARVLGWWWIRWNGGHDIDSAHRDGVDLYYEVAFWAAVTKVMPPPSSVTVKPPPADGPVIVTTLPDKVAL